MPVVVNLEPKKMGPAFVTDSGEAREESQGMVIMMDPGTRVEHGTGRDGPVLIFLPEETVVGAVIR